MRVAGIDCGTNSIRLLIADYQDGRLTDLVREMKIVRLGQDVDKTGRLADEALERTFAAIDDYARAIKEHQVQKVAFVATSASRDAENAAEFVAGVEARLGIKPAVISGHTEASLSFLGASSGLPTDLPLPKLVVDIGGGSTEFAFGAEELESAISVDMGCVRVTERFAGKVNEAPAREFVQALLTEVEKVIDLGKVKTLVGLAGSVTSLTALALGLDSYQPEKIDGTFLSVPEIRQTTERMRLATPEEKAQMGFLHPQRADVIGAGALIWEEIVTQVADRVRQAGGELTGAYTSEHDILDGIALGVATGKL
ncbi:hypothetical protein BK816_06350 [Boudabousia tangfeifanii]|uniref:Ppx/GppA phosphatase N-terminal domain-containing protein n=1 Tax=Boudabousia tangfeifanii TaxID=1912795 RepID=A0A1D9MKZ7_9ACTO|nr:Ppx/GppA phosphatase family protein [Boudabousia tangfeifanii]AOZ72956.1 hypothetical protein BK816_06350 [Boudabousia tangfeifanii]